MSARLAARKRVSGGRLYEVIAAGDEEAAEAMAVAHVAAARRSYLASVIAHYR